MPPAVSESCVPAEKAGPRRSVGDRACNTAGGMVATGAVVEAGSAAADAAAETASVTLGPREPEADALADAAAAAVLAAVAAIWLGVGSVTGAATSAAAAVTVAGRGGAATCDPRPTAGAAGSWMAGSWMAGSCAAANVEAGAGDLTMTGTTGEAQLLGILEASDERPSAGVGRAGAAGRATGGAADGATGRLVTVKVE
jgi:hypothetical protein